MPVRFVFQQLLPLAQVVIGAAVGVPRAQLFVPVIAALVKPPSFASKSLE